GKSEIVAAINAYGICVITCVMLYDPDPVDDRIVESEIGETSSPTAPPAITAAIDGKSNVSSSNVKAMLPVIGYKIAYEPHYVPVETAMIQATIYTIAGISCDGIFEFCTISPKSVPVPSSPINSPVIHASVRTVIGPSIAKNPSLKPKSVDFPVNDLSSFVYL